MPLIELVSITVSQSGWIEGAIRTRCRFGVAFEQVAELDDLASIGTTVSLG